MENTQALEIIKNLASGLDPETGERLAEETIFQRPNTIRALFSAALALEERASRARRRGSLPSNTGKSWMPEDDQRLVAGFESGRSVQTLAGELGRTLTSVNLRLQKLGKMEPGAA